MAWSHTQSALKTPRVGRMDAESVLIADRDGVGVEVWSSREPKVSSCRGYSVSAQGERR
jgi:hypothetical protein